MRIPFETWKAEYEPRIYQDSGAECDEHGWECECEFLYTVDPTELIDDEEDHAAGPERRLWTWHGDGTITSGVDSVHADILITAKPYTEETTVYNP